MGPAQPTPMPSCQGQKQLSFTCIKSLMLPKPDKRQRRSQTKGVPKGVNPDIKFRVLSLGVGHGVNTHAQTLLFRNSIGKPLPGNGPKNNRKNE